MKADFQLIKVSILLTWYWRSGRLCARRHFEDCSAYHTWHCGKRTWSGVLLLLIVSCQIVPGFPPGAHDVSEGVFNLSCSWCWQGHCCNFFAIIFLFGPLSCDDRLLGRDILPGILGGIFIISPVQGAILYAETRHNIIIRDGFADHNGLSVQIHLTGPVWRLGGRWLSRGTLCFWNAVWERDVRFHNWLNDAKIVHKHF